MRLAAGFGAALLVIAYCLVRYGDAVLAFFFLDDFWLLNDAFVWPVRGIADLPKLFGFNHMAFHLYRPLTQRVYFAILTGLFGTDASGFHLVQLAAFSINAILVLAIARRITASLVTGLCVALLYVAAPGHALAVFWIAAFTMIGTAMVVFVMLLFWLVSSGRRRAVGLTLLQIVALLCSEHAVVAPALLAAMALFATDRREPWRAVARTLAGPVSVVVLYVVIKLIYFANTLWPYGSYRMQFDLLLWITSLGRYASSTLSVWTWSGIAEPGGAWFGAAVCAVAVVASACALRGWTRWRLLALGSDLFIIALLPVLPISGHHYSYFIGIAALGAGLGYVGAIALLVGERRVAPLAVAATALVLATDVRFGDVVARNDEVFRLFQNSSSDNAAFLDNLARIRARQPGVWVLVPNNNQTEFLVKLGNIGNVFFSPPMRVLLVPPNRVESMTAFQTYLANPAERHPVQDLPFWWNPDNDWIRLNVPRAHFWYRDTFGAR